MTAAPGHHSHRAVADRVPPRLFTRVTKLQEVPDRYLSFYNHQRPHLGYRTRGRTPAQLFMRNKEASLSAECQHPAGT